MKTKRMVLTGLFSLISLTLLANCISINECGFAFKYNTSKRIKQEFKAGKNSLLSIENKYGNIIFSESTDDKVIIAVDITVSSNKENDLDETLNRIDVLFGDTGNRISAKTVIEPARSNGNNPVSYKINYSVTAPKTILLELINKYGNTTLGSHSGTLRGTFEYGNFYASELSARSVIDIKYGDIDITDCATDLKLDISYGKCRINKAQDLLITSKYSKFDLENVKILTINESKYDKYVIGTVDEIPNPMSVVYTNFNIDQVYTSFNLMNARYCNLSFGLNEHFKECKISGKYTPITIRMAAEASYKYTIQTKYSNINMPSSANVKVEQRNHGSSQSMSGVVNSGASVLDIISEYGTITVKPYYFIKNEKR